MMENKERLEPVELIEVLSEISASLKSVANSLFWLQHKGEVEP